jgi:hypothetical protein
MLADSHNILNRWNKYFSQLLNVHNVSDVKQIEVHTAEPLVPDPSRLEVKLTRTIGKLRKYKSPGSDQIPAELTQAGGEILLSKTKLHGLSPRANYTDRASAVCGRSDCQRLRIEGATWSA